MVYALSAYGKRMTVTEWAMPTVDNIRAEMARKRKTQTQLASVLGISQSGVSHRMSGKTPLTVNEIYAIAQWLEVAPGTFFEQRGSGSAPTSWWLSEGSVVGADLALTA